MLTDIEAKTIAENQNKQVVANNELKFLIDRYTELMNSVDSLGVPDIMLAKKVIYLSIIDATPEDVYKSVMSDDINAKRINKLYEKREDLQKGISDLESAVGRIYLNVPDDEILCEYKRIAEIAKAELQLINDILIIK